MRTPTCLKIALLCGSSVIIYSASAMDLDLIEATIASSLEQPLDLKMIDQLSTDLKNLSAERSERAQALLNEAYSLLISGSKFDEAQKLLAPLKTVPQLKSTVENLEKDLASTISQRAARPTPLTDERLGAEQLAKLLTKEPFTLEDAKETNTIIETAIINNWKNIPELLKSFATRSLQAFVAGTVDLRSIELITAPLTREFTKSKRDTQALITEIFYETIPMISFKKATDISKSSFFIKSFLNALANAHMINQEERDNYFSVATGTQVEKTPITRPLPEPPVALEKDPELAPIITEHSVNKSAIENNRIESTKEGDELVPLLDFPTQFPIKDGSITINVQQMPSLSQIEYRGKSPEAVIKELATAPTSNYCGYYAAYNLWCIITNQQQNIMNRQLFVAHFGPLLLTIKKSNLEEIKKEGFAIKPEKHRVPYDELAGYEIEYLMEKEFNIDPARYLSLGIARGTIKSASESLKVFRARTALLDTFRTPPFEREKTLPILFNVAANHWIAIKATRRQNSLTFEICDSLGKRNWQDIDATPPMNTDILKTLAIYLTTPGMAS